MLTQTDIVRKEMWDRFFPSLDEALGILVASREGRVVVTRETRRRAEEVAKDFLGPNCDVPTLCTLADLLLGVSLDSHRRGYEEGLEEAAKTVRLISGEAIRRKKKQKPC